MERLKVDIIVREKKCQELGCLEVPTLLISACWYLLPPTSESSAASMKACNCESRPGEDHGTRTVRSIETDIHSDHSKPTVLAKSDVHTGLKVPPRQWPST